MNRQTDTFSQEFTITIARVPLLGILPVVGDLETVCYVRGLWVGSWSRYSEDFEMRRE